MNIKVKKHNEYNKINGYAKNREMNDETYALRRLVMDVIYEAKKKLRAEGINLPRIDVRVTEKDAKAVGWAYLNQNIIYIPMQLFTCKNRNKHFKSVVLHEIVHAVTGFRHDDKCPLMCAGLHPTPLTEKVMWAAFMKYFKKGKK